MFSRFSWYLGQLAASFGFSWGCYSGNGKSHEYIGVHYWVGGRCVSYLSARAICKQVMLILIDESDEIDWLVKEVKFVIFAKTSLNRCCLICCICHLDWMPNFRMENLVKLYWTHENLFLGLVIVGHCWKWHANMEHLVLRHGLGPPNATSIILVLFVRVEVVFLLCVCPHTYIIGLI